MYCDGSCRNNGAENASGGFAYAIYVDDVLVECSSGKMVNTTNNIMELRAAIEGCYALERYHRGYCTIYSDSAYIINCYEQKWYKKWLQNNWKNSKGEDVANQDLWKILIKFFEDEHYDFKKVEGHSDDKRNNFVDKMATYAATNNKVIYDVKCDNSSI